MKRDKAYADRIEWATEDTEDTIRDRIVENLDNLASWIQTGGFPPSMEIDLDD
jgi:hypothetical protein